MSYLWLRYKQDGVQYAQRFDAVYNYDGLKLDRSLVPGKRGNLYRFINARWGIHRIEIASDELYITANRDFLNSFWFATEQHLSLSVEEVEPGDDEFFLVDAGDGDSPEEFLNNNKHFPIWTLVLNELNSRVWNSGTETFDTIYLA